MIVCSKCILNTDKKTSIKWMCATCERCKRHWRKCYTCWEVIENAYVINKIGITADVMDKNYRIYPKEVLVKAIKEWNDNHPDEKIDYV